MVDNAQIKKKGHQIYKNTNSIQDILKSNHMFKMISTNGSSQKWFVYVHIFRSHLWHHWQLIFKFFTLLFFQSLVRTSIYQFGSNIQVAGSAYSVIRSHLISLYASKVMWWWSATNEGTKVLTNSKAWLIYGTNRARSTVRNQFFFRGRKIHWERIKAKCEKPQKFFIEFNANWFHLAHNLMNTPDQKPVQPSWPLCKRNKTFRRTKR